MPFTPEANHKYPTNVYIAFKRCLLYCLGCAIYSLILLIEILDLNCFRYFSIALIRFSLSLGNEISQVEGLEGLQQLRELVLDRNRIKALADNSFIAQNVLLELHLAENRIRELNHLDPLTELRKLFLGMNKLQVFSSSGSSLPTCWIFKYLYSDF